MTQKNNLKTKPTKLLRRRSPRVATRNLEELPTAIWSSCHTRTFNCVWQCCSTSGHKQLDALPQVLLSAAIRHGRSEWTRERSQLCHNLIRCDRENGEDRCNSASAVELSQHELNKRCVPWCASHGALPLQPLEASSQILWAPGSGPARRSGQRGQA